jgi:hypothetical protein
MTSIKEHSNQNLAPILSLPTELQWEIMVFLTLEDILALCTTCKLLYSISLSDCFWKFMCKVKVTYSIQFKLKYTNVTMSIKLLVQGHNKRPS